MELCPIRAGDIPQLVPKHSPCQDWNSACRFTWPPLANPLLSHISNW